MTVRIISPKLRWQSKGMAQGTLDVIDRVLRSWGGTPYESGQAFIQRGADCTGSLFAIVDTLDGRKRIQPPGFPHDGAMHDRAGAVAAMREVMRRYDPVIRLTGVGDDGFLEVEPGDIIVTGDAGGGPGHIEMVGARRNELWHATDGPGFHQSGWGFFEGQTLFAVYRILDKHRWM